MDKILIKALSNLNKHGEILMPSRIDLPADPAGRFILNSTAVTKGESDTINGVYGRSKNHTGVIGESETGTGVSGESITETGVSGFSQSGDGVFGTGRRGVVGESETFQGVLGKSRDNAGIVGESALFHAVFGISHSIHNGGLFGTNNAGGFGVLGLSESGNSGIGVFGKGSKLAALFEGDVEVTGDIRLTNADCAEDFDIVGLVRIEAGTVMVIDSEGALRPSDQAYDKRVAGVISGAGNFKPGIVLDKQESSNNRMPIALLGKVYCKVDAQYGAIEVGDLLTTSPTPGHAMVASESVRAFGTIIGKALRPLLSDKSLIPILVALQ
jgi:hypothetical protein